MQPRDSVSTRRASRELERAETRLIPVLLEGPHAGQPVPRSARDHGSLRAAYYAPDPERPDSPMPVVDYVRTHIGLAGAGSVNAFIEREALRADPAGGAGPVFRWLVAQAFPRVAEAEGEPTRLWGLDATLRLRSSRRGVLEMPLPFVGDKNGPVGGPPIVDFAAVNRAVHDATVRGDFWP